MFPLHPPPFFLLDLDGTLVRFSWLDPALVTERRRLHELAQQLPEPPPPGLLFPALLRLGRERPEVLAALEDIEQRAAEGATVCSGAVELLLALREKPTAIVTNNGRAAVQAALRMLSGAEPRLVLDELPLICRDDVTRPKPDPEPFCAALQKLRPRFGEPASVLVVGDSLADVQAASALAAAHRPDAPGALVVTALGVEGGVGKADDLRTGGAAQVFPTLHGLIELLADRARTGQAR